jgi:phosphonate transport system substrate-binding protein
LKLKTRLELSSSLSKWILVPLALIFALGALACGPSQEPVVLKIGGIPDQDASRLARRYDGFASYLADKLDVPVEYVPSVDYAAVVTAFGQDQLQVAFFGGLTGVQARLQNPGAQAIVQREDDARFHSKFIARADLPIESLEDLKAQASQLTITFGSPSSTSGHLMPRHFLIEAGIDPETAFREEASFSGSHDATWQLVESGAFDIGALNEDVWDRAVREGTVDTNRVKEFYVTPDYFDYNWTVRADLDQVYGGGFTARLQQALLDLNPQEHAEILELFSTEKFITTTNSNYQDIEDVGRKLGLIR